MATSSKVVFSLETLKAKALEAFDARIARAEAHLASYDDDTAYQQEVREWREHQRNLILTLAARIDSGQVADSDLTVPGLRSMPDPPRSWEQERAKADLERLHTQRIKITAKADSLVPDADGNVALTKTQLSEFFGL
jgi:hypothetical protein